METFPDIPDDQVDEGGDGTDETLPERVPVPEIDPLEDVDDDG